MKLVNLTFILYLFVPTLCQKPLTELELIVDDLSTLNRVTNAIALQSSSLQKTLNIDALVGELLNVDEQVFKEMKTLRHDMVRRDFRNFYANVTSIRNPSLSDPDHDDFTDLVIAFEAILYNGTLRNLTYFSADPLINLIKNDKGFELPCSGDTLRAVAKFTKVDLKSVEVSKFTEHSYQLALRKLTKDIVKCFKSCEQLLNLGDVFEELEALNKANAVADFWIQYNKLFTVISGFPSMLQKARRDFQLAQKLRSNEQLGPRLRELRLYFETLRAQPNPSLSLTAGFQGGFEDLFKVQKDIKSQWFTKKVARGKSISELDRALGPFYRLAEKVDSLRKPWENLRFAVNKGDVLENDMVQIYLRIKLVQTFMGTDKVLRDSEKIAGECWNKTLPELVDQVALDKFKKAFQHPAEVLESIKQVVHEARSVYEVMNSTQFEELMLKVEGAISLNSTEDDVVYQRRAFRKIDRRVVDVFLAMEDLWRAQNDYTEAWSNLKSSLAFDAKTFNLEAATKASKVVELIECYENRSFDVLKLSDVRIYLTTVEILKHKGQFDLMDGLLGKLSDVRNIFTSIHATNNTSTKPVRDPVLKLNDSLGLSLHLASGIKVVHEMIRARRENATLLKSLHYPEKSVMWRLRNGYRDRASGYFWADPNATVRKVLEGLDEFEVYAKGARAEPLRNLHQFFQRAEKVPGIAAYREIFTNAAEAPNYNGEPEIDAVHENAAKLLEWDLDFARHKTSLNAAKLSVKALSAYFDDIFGFKTKDVTVIQQITSSWAAIVISIGIFLLLLLVCFIAYGFTSAGRNKYYDTYLYYFPNQDVFERRWRYSLFLDRENGDNALIDACREINPINAEIALQKGAYVNVYSVHGNTPLHMATMKGFAEIVELLIRNGADRSMLNCRNRLAEQCVPENYREMPAEEAKKYERIVKIYEKHRGKKYRIRVPRVLATHLFHIFIEKRTEDTLTNAFMACFMGITSEEPLFTTTHCVCHTSSDGVLETDDFELLSWIFYGVIMVKESWMEECIRNKKAIRQDHKFLVEHVRYGGVLYKNCIIPWSQARAKGTMPYLYGVYVTIIMVDCPLLNIFAALVKALGGEMLDAFPEKEDYNAGSHPYLHIHLGPLFLIHDGKTDLSAYAKDPMFTLFTENEFVAFLLKREIHQDKSPDPIPKRIDLSAQQ